MEVVTVPVPANTSAGPLQPLKQAIEDFQSILTNGESSTLSISQISIQFLQHHPNK